MTSAPVRAPRAWSRCSWARVASPGRSHVTRPVPLSRVSRVSRVYSNVSPARASWVNWNRTAAGSSPTWRMIRWSDSFLQARVKACFGASSRATDSSSPASARAATRAGWVTVTPEQVQAITSPSRRVPAATGKAAVVVIGGAPSDGEWETNPPGRGRPAGGRPRPGGEGESVWLQGQDPADGRVLSL